MTRIEKIRKMTSEEMAKEIYAKAVDYCDYCGNNEYDCTDKSCEEGIKQRLEGEVEMTADEMLEKLGYKVDAKQENDFIAYFNNKIQKNGKDKGLKILKECGKWMYSVFWYETLDETESEKVKSRDIAYITEEEDKAIHKKLEELKNDKQ